MSKKIKILQVLRKLDTSEVAHSTMQLAKSLVQSGYDSCVLSDGGIMQETLEKEGSEHFTLPVHEKSLFNFNTIWRIRALFMRERFDIVHIHSRMSAWFVYAAWKQLPSSIRPKLVTTFNSYYPIDAYAEVVSKGEAIICPSKSVRNFVLANYPSTLKKKLKLVHKGIDSRNFPYGYQPNPKWLDEWSNESSSFKDKFIISLPGSISSKKGHFDFLHILYYLKNDGIPVHGLIMGSSVSKDEAYYARLKNSIQNLELSDDVSFLNDRKDLREIIAVSDLVLSCSIMPESFDKASLVTLSLGVPLIAYSHGVLREHLNALYPYGIVEANKKSSMRLKIREFYHLKEKPKPHKNERFTKEHAHKGVFKIYSELLKK
jgi:glycosyltransferase involved in cell wall biosynthesis